MLSEFIDRWSSRLANALAIWPLFPAGAVVIVTQRLAATADYLEFLGPFGWWSIALTMGILTYLAINGGQLWSVSRRLKHHQIRLAERTDSADLINPLAQRFYQRKIHFSDLVPPFGQPAIDKSFEECTLVGPAVVVMVGCEVSHCEFTDVHFVKVKNDAIFEGEDSVNISPSRLTLIRAGMRKCKIYSALVLVPEAMVGDFENGLNGNVPWLN